MSDYVTGAKFGQPQAPKQPSIAPDSAQSKTFIKILYGLSEGEIAGLANGYKSLYLEDTPLHDDNGNPTVQNVTVDYRAGTNDQTYIDGFPDVRNEVAIGIALKANAPFIRSFNNRDIDAVDVRLTWGALRKQDKDGNVTGTTVEYAIDVQTDGRGYVEVLRESVTAKTSANYTRQRRIDLPRAENGWQIRVRRITPDSTSDLLQDAMQVEAMTEVIDLKMRYPNTALLGLQYDAESFNNVAKVAVECKGKIIKVPSNYDPVARTYSGMWNGTFKQAYTNNPAWIYYDICTNDRYGLGNRLSQFMLDKWSLYRLAQYCDEMVDNGEGGLEPRFTLNVYLQSADDAYAILSRIAGVFRAISYWDGERIVCDADIPQDTYFSYSMANVIDGHFEYTGTRARDRHTVVKVAWDNPKNRYKTEYEFVRDEAAISKLGVRILDLEAWGCTSRGQAQRAGLWALKSEQLETRQVSFKVGLDGYIPLPGKVIEVSDALFAGRANGGRVSAISADGLTVTLDRDVTVKAGDTLVINGNDGKAQRRSVTAINGRVITISSGFSNIEPQNVWVLDAQDLATMKFRVLSVTQDDKHQFTIKAIQYEPKKYSAIDAGAYVDTVPISIVNPTVQEAVSSVVITSENRIEQGINITALVIGWAQAQGATKYLVEWRKDGGNWIRLPLTGSVSIDVQGVYAGNYEARVTAISAFDMSSQPTYSALTPITGKVGKPPKVASITATGLLFAMRIDWTFPQGAADTAYTEVQVSPDGVSNIAALGQYAYPTNTATINGLQGKLTQFYRARLVDRIGNVGDWSNWVSGTTTSDAQAVLDILSGQITESQLYEDLGTKIGKIDTIDKLINPEMAGSGIDHAGGSSLVGIWSETSARIENDIKIAQETSKRLAEQAEATRQGLVAEQDARFKAIAETAKKIDGEYKQHIKTLIEAPDGINDQILHSTDGLVTYLKTYKDSNGKYVGGVVDEVTTKIGDNGTLVTKLDGVFAAQNPEMAGSKTDFAGSGNFAGVWTEMSARIEGDLAEAKRTNTLIAEASENVKAFTRSEVQATAQGLDTRLVKTEQSAATNGKSIAALTEAIDLRVTANGAYAKKISDLDIKYGGDGTQTNRGLIFNEQDARVEADKVIVKKLDGVYAELDPEMAGATTVQKDKYNELTGKYDKVDVTFYAGADVDSSGKKKYSGSWSERSATIEANLAISKKVDTTIAKLGQNEAAITTEIQARVDADGALSKRIDTINSEFQGNSYTAITEWMATAKANEVVGGKITTAIAQYKDPATGSTLAKSSDVTGLTTRLYKDGTGDIVTVKSDVATLKTDVYDETGTIQTLLVQERTSRTKGSTALADKIDGLFIQTYPEMAGADTVEKQEYDAEKGEYKTTNVKVFAGAITNRVGVWTEMSARLEKEASLASKIDRVESSLKDTRATYEQEILTYASGLDAAVANIEKVQRQVNGKTDSIEVIAALGDVQKLKLLNEKARNDNDIDQLNDNKTELQDQITQIDKKYNSLVIKRDAADTPADVRAEINTELGKLETAKAEAQAAIAAIPAQIAQLQKENATLTSLVKTESDIKKQYTVKIDSGGAITGYGLALDNNDKSTFLVRADKFALAAPQTFDVDGNPLKSKVAFVYKAADETLSNGTVIPSGLYLDSAFIGSIDAGKIKADKLSAISADLGTMVSGNPNGARTVISGDRTEVYDENNQLRVRLGRW